MVVPAGRPTFAEALRAGAETFHALRGLLKKRGLATGVGDEGGFAPSLSSNREAVELVLEAVQKAGYHAGRDLFLALDVASSEFWDEGSKTYVLKKSGEGTRASDQMIALYEDWTRQYPIVSIEDGLAEGDWPGWQRLTAVARRPRPARRRRRVRDEPGDSEARHQRARGQRAAREAQPDRHGQRDDGRGRDGPRGRLRERHFASIGRDRGHDDRRPRRRHRRGPDQDRLGQPVRSHREIQPAAADRGSARRQGALRRSLGHPTARR